MEYLKRAEQYATARGDLEFFQHYYTLYRSYFSVRESVWRTLDWLYDGVVADQLEI